MKRSAYARLALTVLAIAAVAAFVQALSVQVPGENEEAVLLSRSHELLHKASAPSSEHHARGVDMAQPNPQLKLAGDSLTSFGAELFARVCGKNEGNVFISPLSIASALAMVASGATPSSQVSSAFSSVLRLDMQKPTDLAAWQGASASLSDSGSVKLLQANSLWAHSAVLPSYRDKVQQAFGALVSALPQTAAPINSWTSEHTGGLIPTIVDDATVADPLTRAVLVNAVYFKGDWDKAFPKESTRRATFTTPAGEVPCMMMGFRSTVQLPWAELPDGSTAVALPYKGKRFRQLLLLPGAGSPDARAAGALAASLRSGAALAAARAALDSPAAPQRVRLHLPRFRLEFGPRDLKPELAAAGLGSAFGGSGGFLGVAADPELHLSKVFHKAVVEVNEEGTEAAAATAAVMMTRSARIEPPPKEFVVDRPFVMVIEDTHTGAPLFMGRVVSPTFTGLDGADAAAAAEVAI